MASSSNTTKALSAVWGAGSGDVWTTGESGVTLRWNGAQRQWQSAASTSSQNLLALGGTGTGDVWALGVSGECIHWTGQSWNKCSIMGVGNVLAAWAGAGADAWAVGQYGALLHWDGGSWQQKTTGYTTDQLAGIWGTGASQAWAVGATGTNTGTLFRWDGNHWQRGNSPTQNISGMAPLTGIWGSFMTNSPPDVWLTGPGGLLLHGDGNNFQQIGSGTTSLLSRVWGVPTTMFAWAVGDGGVISTGKGTSPWTSTNPAPMKPLRDVSGSSVQDIFAVGDAGTVLHFDGTMWQQQAAGMTSASLGAVWAGDKVFVAGAGGVIMSKPSGGSWTMDTVPASLRCDFSTLWGAGNADVWAAGNSGCIAHFDGTSWQVSNSGARSALQGLWGSSETDLWAVGSGGTILHYPGVR